MKIAVIADIHGNAPALEAVLEDIAQAAVDQILDLGDAFNGPIDPARVAALLQLEPMIHVRGNGERMVIAPTAAERSLSAEFARICLSPAQLAWIQAWPPLYHTPDLLACHGSPTSDTEYLLEELIPNAVRLRPRADIQARLGAVDSSLVLCAHSHVPRLVQVSSTTLILNPGSVGLPAYTLDAPIPHKMEVGSPGARYAIVEQLKAGWRVTHIAVPYDGEAAARMAERAGFPAWANTLRSGYAV